VLPDRAAVHAALEKQGYKFKEKGILNILSKLTIIAPDNTEKVFADEDALLNSARQQMVEWITMSSVGKAFAEKAAKEQTITLPVALWFLPRV
jgi:hypothetical protein